jgi:diaminopimelate epimerase
MNFYKYHALGNSYLILDTAVTPTTAQIQTLCHPAYGLGADGILIGAPHPDKPNCFTLRIFNPDGSDAEKSGNGLRIFARYLWDDLAVAEEPFTIQTQGGLVQAQVQEPYEAIVINLGCWLWQTRGGRLTVQGQELVYYAGSLGNPHCVVVVPESTAVLAQTLGPELEFATGQRTNVQFVQVLDEQTLRLEVWERGAGYTLSSGASSGAATAVAHALGLCGRRVTVQMAGGELQTWLNEANELLISGAVSKICEGRLSRDIWPEQTVACLTE